MSLFNFIAHTDIFYSVFDNRSNQSCNTLAFAVTKNIGCWLWQVFFFKHSRTYWVVYVMVNIGYLIRKAHNIALFCNGNLVCMAGNAVFYFVCKIKSCTVVFYIVNHADALKIVLEAVRAYLIKNVLSGVTERSVSQVVSKGDSFGQILVKPECPWNSTRDLRHLKSMCEPCSVMVADWGEEYLSLLLQSPERIAVKYSVPVTLKFRSKRTFGLTADASARTLWRTGVFA